eukprot:scaffold10305_cov115-Skeletonema_marinoi.AAC.1
MQHSTNKSPTPPRSAPTHFKPRLLTVLPHSWLGSMTNSFLSLAAVAALSHSQPEEQSRQSIVTAMEVAEQDIPLRRQPRR